MIMKATIPQAMVDQTPKFDKRKRKCKGKCSNQVISKSGIIRPDKRHKCKYL